MTTRVFDLTAEPFTPDGLADGQKYALQNVGARPITFGDFETPPAAGFRGFKLLPFETVAIVHEDDSPLYFASPDGGSLAVADG